MAILFLRFYTSSIAVMPVVVDDDVHDTTSVTQKPRQFRM